MNAPTGADLAPLPPLSTPCLKCGGELRTLRWIPAAGDRTVDELVTAAAGPALDPREHMQVTCASCGYVWAAAPLDTSETESNLRGG